MGALKHWLPILTLAYLGCETPAPSETEAALGSVSFALEVSPLMGGVQSVEVALLRDGVMAFGETVEVTGTMVQTRLMGVPAGSWILGVDGKDRRGATIFCGLVPIEVLPGLVTDATVPLRFTERCDLTETVCDDEVDDDGDGDTDCADGDCAADAACLTGVCAAFAPPALQAVATIGSAGGTLAIPAYGLSAQIPPGKLAVATEVKLVAWGFPQSYAERPVSPFFELTPAGTEAVVSIDMTVAAGVVDLAGVAIYAGFAGESSNALSALATTRTGSTLTATLPAVGGATAFQVRRTAPFAEPFADWRCMAEQDPTSLFTQSVTVARRAVPRATGTGFAAVLLRDPGTPRVEAVPFATDGTGSAPTTLVDGGALLGMDAVALPGGDWVLALARQGTFGGEVEVRRVTSAGVLVGAPRAVHDFDSFVEVSEPKIVRLSNGSFVVAWKRKGTTSNLDLRVRMAWVAADLSTSTARNADSTLGALGFDSKMGDWAMVTDGVDVGLAWADQAQSNAAVVVKYQAFDGGACPLSSSVNLLIGKSGAMKLDGVIVPGYTPTRALFTATAEGFTDARLVTLGTGALGPGATLYGTNFNASVALAAHPSGFAMLETKSDNRTSYISKWSAALEPLTIVEQVFPTPAAHLDFPAIVANAARSHFFITWVEPDATQAKAQAVVVNCP